MSMPRVAWLSDRSVLVQDVKPRDFPTVERRLAESIPGVEVRRGLDTVVASLPLPTPWLFSEVQEAVSDLCPNSSENYVSTSGREVVIPVIYDGEDLSEAAAALGLSTRELAEKHRDTAWTVSMIGFAPGFPYLSPLSATPAFDLPRRATPRSSVPAGSVGIAAGMSCVYPSRMPGGWWLIGSSPVQLFDANADSPALLHAGDVVLFEEQST